MASGWRELIGEGRAPRIALICLGVWLNAADALVTATIMPSVGADLGGYGYFGWATAGYFTGAIIAGATAGRLSEMFSLRPATMAAGLIYAAGCVVSALGTDIGFFLAGRIVQGLGAGWISGFSYVALALVLPERLLPRAFAVVAGIWGLATLLGPLAGGLFAAAGAWRGVFWLFALQAAAFALAAAFLLPARAQADRPGGVPAAQVALIAAGVVAISVSGMGGGLLLVAGLAGLGLLGIAVRLDGRAEARLFPRQAGALSTPIGAGYAALFTMFAAGMGLSTYGPAVLQALRGLSPLEAGYVIGAEAFGWTLAAFLVARAGGAWPARWIRTGSVLLLAALIGLALAVPAAPLALVVLAGGLTGAGYGVSWSFMSQRILAHAPHDERAVASSSLGAVQQTGAAVGAALSGAVANLAGATGDAFAAGTARSVGVWVFLAGVPLALLGVQFAWRLARSAPSPAVEPAPVRG